MTSSVDPSDMDLMQRISQGDQQAISELYDQYGSTVYSVCLHILNNPAIAEECTQDTFMTVWEQVEKWDPDRGSVKTWLYILARYTALDRLRKESRQSTWKSVSIQESMPPLEKLHTMDDYQWDRQLLQSLMLELPPEQVEAIQLAFFKGMTHEEIAKKTGQPLGTTKSRIRQGLHTLKGLWIRAVGTKR